MGTFLIGGLIGVAIGIMLAPRTGTEMRAALKDKSDRFKEKLMSAKAHYQEGKAQNN